VRHAGRDVRTVDEHVINAARGRLVHTHAGGGVGLRVKVTQQDAIAFLLEGGGQVDTGRRFADAALLIDDCNDFSQKNTHLSHRSIDLFSFLFSIAQNGSISTGKLKFCKFVSRET
jgi:hypothetical protein